MRALLIAVLATFSLAAGAAEVEGVKFPERIALPGGKALLLNGAGLRTRLFFKVYAIGLYLPARTTKPAAAIDLAGPKLIMIRMLRDVDAGSFAEALDDGLKANHSKARMKALAPRVAQLNAIMKSLKQAKEGMEILILSIDGTTRVSVAGKAIGKPIRGADFFPSLLRVWLGRNPVQGDLRDALLGKAK